MTRVLALNLWLVTGCTGQVVGGAGTGGPGTGGPETAGDHGDPDHDGPDDEMDPRSHDDFQQHCDGSHAHAAHPDDEAKADEHDAFLSLFPQMDEAGVSVAVQDGSWFSAATWSTGSVPGDSARVHIPCGRTVWYDGESDARLDRIGVLGTLHFAVDKNTKLVTDSLLASPDSVFTVGLDSAPVQAGVRAQIIIHQDNGPIGLAEDPKLLTKGVVTHGVVRIAGQDKADFLLTDGAQAGDMSLLFESEPVGWQTGDKLVVTATHNERSRTTRIMSLYRDEVVRVVAVTPEGSRYRVTLDRALQYDHVPPATERDIRLQVPVANYTRNVFIGTETDGDQYLADGKTVPVPLRGHVMFMHNRDVSVRNAEFFELGRTDKDEFFSETNVAGRYALHFHRTGADSSNKASLARGNAIWGSPGWGIVHHDAHLDVIDNAVFGVVGSGIVAEAGNETGFWIDNIVVQTSGRVRMFNAESQKPDRGDVVNQARLENNTFIQGEAFGMKSRLLTVNGNYAVSANGAGFSFWPHGSSGPSHIDGSGTDFMNVQGYDPYFGQTVSPGRVATRDFQDNVVIASRHALNTSSAKIDHRSDLDILIEDLLAWNVDQPIMSFYQRNYIIKDCVFIRGVANGDFVDGTLSSEDDDKPNENTASHIHDAKEFKLVSNYFEGFDVITKEPMRFIFGNTVVGSPITEQRGRDGLFREGRTDDNDAIEMLDNSPDWLDDLPNPAGTLGVEIDMGASDFVMEGGSNDTAIVVVHKTDSLGTRRGMLMGLPNHDNEFRIAQPRDVWSSILARDGYYQQPNGDLYMLIPIVVGDRLTGTVGQVHVAIHLAFMDSPPADTRSNGPLPAGLEDHVGEFEIVDRRVIGMVGNQL